ncbi:MAG: pyridine nucleotide-disulfide oxidoreductase [Betaproteobacteria bacterium]|nr:pyridine nucleotide-disulfide oxidoreductase [Betaproteobacteria bacterium]
MDLPIVIIGTGQAGLQTAEALRAEGWQGDLILLGEEPHAPYHRPPLSKAYLMGESSAEQLTMRRPEALSRKAIEIRIGCRVNRIDCVERVVHLDQGDRLAYHRLVLATGARARQLPGADWQGVFQLRTLEDCTRIGEAMATAHHIAVIGGGFIGLEFAAVARKKGKSVTVIEAANRLMARAVSAEVSEIYARLHTERGVVLRLGSGVAGFTSTNGRVSGITLSDGHNVSADLVLMGIGILPNQELAEAAGISCASGIIIDSCGRTSDPFVFACGDCTATRLENGDFRRLESVQNAIEQAKSCAASIMNRERPFTAAPWFWSDQYDVKLQMVGTSQGHDHSVIRGDTNAYKCSIFYFAGERLIGIDSLNRPQDHMAGRRLLDEGMGLTPQQAADESFLLNQLFKRDGVSA